MFAVKLNDKQALVMRVATERPRHRHLWHRQAVPSFGRQTGMECSACHTVFPQLTPFGREFKLGGYVMSDGQKKKLPPLSAGVQFSYTSVEKKGDEAEGWRVPQDLSVYYGGKIASKGGDTHPGFLYEGKGTSLSGYGGHPLRRPMEAVAGSGTGSPDSNGYIAEVNYLLMPMQGMDIKLALQYTAYNSSTAQARTTMVSAGTPPTITRRICWPISCFSWVKAQ